MRRGQDDPALGAQFVQYGRYLLTFSRGGIAGAPENIFCVDGKLASYRLASPDPRPVSVRVNGELRTENTQRR